MTDSLSGDIELPPPQRRGHLRHPQTGRFVPEAEVALRDTQAVKLKVAGLTYTQIAEQLGYESRYGAQRSVERALYRERLEPVEELRTLELERLDALQRRLTEIMLHPGYVHSAQGKVVCDPATGEPLPDKSTAVRAALGIVRVSESRRKLQGTDPPQQHANWNMNVDVDAQIEDMLVKLRDGYQR